MHEKTMTHRSCLRWKPTDKIFKIVGLRWIPNRKIFTSSTTKVDSEPQNGSNDDITIQYECKQTLDVSAGTLNIHAGTSLNPTKEGLRAMTSDHNSLELGIHDHINELSSSKLVPKVVPPADKTATSRQELELLFHHHITMLRSTCKGCSNESWEALKGLRIKKGIVWINGDKKEALHTSLAINLGQYICCLEPQCHLSEDTTTFIEFLTSKGTYALSWKPCQGDSLNLPDHRYQVYQGRLLASFQDDAKYEHVGQDTRSQGGKDDQDGRIKI
ncbi:hypothetical protein Tco_1473585 [Tanacetum coccineum]